ncbi:MAG: hypothetical protein RL385_6084 [Pseudomonadota bacterium]
MGASARHAQARRRHLAPQAPGLLAPGPLLRGHRHTLRFAEILPFDSCARPWAGADRSPPIFARSRHTSAARAPVNSLKHCIALHLRPVCPFGDRGAGLPVREIAQTTLQCIFLFMERPSFSTSAGDGSPSSDDAASLAPILRIGRYDVLGRLAVGGMSELFFAHERIAGETLRRVVIKLLAAPEKSVLDDAGWMALFEREGRVSARLDHPNICHVYEFGHVGPHCFIAMEWIKGVSLRELLVHLRDSETNLPRSLAINICAQVAAALDHARTATNAHDERLSVVHRDVNPANIMIRHDGVVKLVDFGVAQVEEQRACPSNRHIQGKLAYMAPEQLRGDELDHRADIFALGICLYTRTARRHPGGPQRHRSPRAAEGSGKSLSNGGRAPSRARRAPRAARHGRQRAPLGDIHGTASERTPFRAPAGARRIRAYAAHFAPIAYVTNQGLGAARRYRCAPRSRARLAHPACGVGPETTGPSPRGPPSRTHTRRRGRRSVRGSSGGVGRASSRATAPAHVNAGIGFPDRRSGHGPSADGQSARARRSIAAHVRSPHALGGRRKTPRSHRSRSGTQEAKCQTPTT